MEVIASPQARQDFRKLPRAIRKKVEKQLIFLGHDLHHPSIHAKKYSEADDMWQGRVDQSYRFYFSILGDTYYIHAIGKHPK